jgi:oxygen-independent coproporphyrinogen-3 oxidase
MTQGERESNRRNGEELERQMYETLTDRLTAAGYEHYEISNFARPGYRSRHNSSYWNDVPYIGLGAAAHSYDLASRSWNVADIRQYIEAIEKGEIPCEREVLDADTHYNDRVTTALRTSDGLDLTTLSDRHRTHCLHEAHPFLDDGLLRLAGNRLVLTRRGLFVSDMVMSGLMMV